MLDGTVSLQGLGASQANAWPETSYQKDTQAHGGSASHS